MLDSYWSFRESSVLTFRLVNDVKTWDLSKVIFLATGSDFQSLLMIMLFVVIKNLQWWNARGDYVVVKVFCCNWQLDIKNLLYSYILNEWLKWKIKVWQIKLNNSTINKVILFVQSFRITDSPCCILSVTTVHIYEFISVYYL